MLRSPAPTIQQAHREIENYSNRDVMANNKDKPRTMAEKVWADHVVASVEGEPDLIYIDLHLVHEVTSPQAFDGLRLAGRPVHRPDLTIATEDHNVPTV